MTNERPIAIDLFAGAGGLSLGFEQAGFDVAAAVEIDPVHAAVHLFNFPRTAVIPRSVVGLSARDVRKAAGIGNRPVDVVFGGPPCQGFSSIGQRMLRDPRNGLVREFVRLVVELRAKTFVMENVKGLTIGKHRRFLDEVIAAFGEAGYVVRAPWAVLDAQDYGVPQHRERLFLLGARKGSAPPDYPPPATAPDARKPRGAELPPTPTCADALGDLPDADRFAALLDGDAVAVGRLRAGSPYARALRVEKDEHWFRAYPRRWDCGLLTSSARTEHTEISRRRFRETPTGDVEPISRFLKLDPDGRCNTLRAGTDSARGAFTSPRPIHYAHPRCVTVREMARLHGFPDWFRFHVTKWHGARQVGNSVAPPVARAVGEAVLRALGRTAERPTEPLDLGDPRLLALEAGEAARFWGVPAPSTKRDRRSGLKKRKQADIEAARVAAGSAT
jgi:DNA (cytosine-5)-methyltransferase 1